MIRTRLFAAAVVALAVLPLLAAPQQPPAVFDLLLRSVVKIRSYKGATILKDSSGLVREDFEYGTGFVVDESLIVTAKHTVHINGVNSRSVQCWSPERGRYEGCVILFVSADRDIAVLWYPGAPRARLTLRAGDEKLPGALLLAGFPDTPYARPRMMLTEGEVVDWKTSAPGAAQLRERRNLASADVLAFPGCSGSPLLTRQLEVAGMVVSVLQDDEGQWTGSTYFVHSIEIADALAQARHAIAKKKGYEFLDPK